DPTKSTFADRANIRVHLALCDAENSKRHGQRTTDRDRDAHLIPASAADTRSMVANCPWHLTTYSKINELHHPSPSTIIAVPTSKRRTDQCLAKLIVFL